MRILLFHSDVERLNLLAFCLESQLKYNVAQASNLEIAMETLLGEEKIDLIIVGQLIKKRFPRGAPSEDKDGDLVRININLLLRIVPLKGDIFIKISSLKFVKLFKAGAVFTQDDLNRVWGVKKIEYLYILRSDSQEFMKKLQEDLNLIVAKALPDDPAYLDQLSEAQETIQSLSKQVGFTPEVASLTKSVVSATLKVIGNSPKLSGLVFSALQKKNYLSGHSVLLAQVSCYIAAKLNWPSESTFHKLVLASFLHDITISDVEMAKARTKDDLNTLSVSMSPEELDAIRTHPYSAGEILNKIPEVPSDVFAIVTQHHERHDGNGFPRGLPGSQIAPLAAVFIIAEDAVDYLFAHQGEMSLETYFQTQLPDYTAGVFKKVARSLKTGS